MVRKEPEVDRPATYECYACGHRERSEDGLLECPECGGRVQNLAKPRS